MHTSERLRFALILEAYCRGCGSYIKPLIRQVDALEKLTNLTDQLKQKADVSPSVRPVLPLRHLTSVIISHSYQDDVRKVLEAQMLEPDYVEALQHFTSPLDSSNLLGKLRTSCSKVSCHFHVPLHTPPCDFP